MSTNAFKNKVALVTGGSFGIGRATAIAFAAEGAKVVVADHVEDSTTVDAIRAAGGEATFIRCDVSRMADVQDMVQRILRLYGRLDIAFNNAGIEGVMAPTHECTEENWDRIHAVNVKGVWACMKEELIVMLGQGSGAIVNCSSIAGLVGFPGLPSYVASKHAIVGLTKAAALEYAKKGIRINAVCPGAIFTPMLSRLAGGDQAAHDNFGPMEPMGRIGTPEEIASAVLWLCSEGASFTTGQALAVDGGWVAQ
jgi:NAD(P)-dependent dehydrogenase (short-subunit alcohol dehydrogenase family)